MGAGGTGTKVREDAGLIVRQSRASAMRRSRRESVGHIIRLYTLTEMTRLLERVGLQVTAVFGGFDSEAYAISTRRMIIVARK